MLKSSKLLSVFFLVVLLCAQSLASLASGPSTTAFAGEKETERINNAATMFDEIMKAPDKGVPGDLLETCAALILIPGVKKGAFIFGGEYGKGLMLVRNPDKSWNIPGFIRMDGGSVGFQIGGQSIDVILVVKNRKGIEKLTSNKFKLGADASVAGGPVGRDAKANTDAQMQAQILSYSRTQGAFAGVSLEGAALRLDDNSNKSVYGRALKADDVLNPSSLKAPAAADELYKVIRKYAK